MMRSLRALYPVHSRWTHGAGTRAGLPPRFLRVTAFTTLEPNFEGQ